MTNTKAAAHHLATKGRHGDSMLVHMSPIEVWALERMAPEGKLTRNPDTGLPEAFSLGDFLPALAGIGASFLFPGAGALLPSLVAGGTSYATTGDLGKGLMSGLLSYGVGSALSSAAAPTAQVGSDALASGTGSAIDSAASTGLTSGYTPPADLIGGVPSGSFVPGDIGSSLGSTGSFTNAIADTASNAGTAASSAAGETAKAVSAMNPLEKAQAAFANLQADPGGTLNRTFIDNFKTTTLPIAGSVLGSMAMEPAAPMPLVGGTEPTRAELERRYPEQFPDPFEVRFPGSDYNPGTSPEFDYFRPTGGMAEGGIASLMGSPDALYAKGGIADPDGAKGAKANIEAEAKMALLDHHPKASEALARYEQVFGSEALENLRRNIGVAGGRIRGAGGGLDDLIPGTIEGRKDVRLADGEFVVPADVVSMLGDGSSDHGVRKLHEMMDRVRVSKTGTKKQAGPTKDRKVMPA